MTTMRKPQAFALRAALIAMLIIALRDNPYGYYQLLRWACLCGFAYLAFGAASRGASGWAWVYGAVAVLYNPIVPFALGRDMWEIANIATAALLAVSALLDRPVALPLKQGRPT